MGYNSTFPHAIDFYTFALTYVRVYKLGMHITYAIHFILFVKY
jgi:hypothetical protein